MGPLSRAVYNFLKYQFKSHVEQAHNFSCRQTLYNTHMTQSQHSQLLDDDKKYVWHPYSAINSDAPIFPVTSAHGVKITLEDGTQLIDGMSSWWCAIHGYNVPALNAAINQQ